MKSVHKPKAWRSARCSVFAIVLGLAVILAPGARADVANDDCMACHDDVGESFTMTSHGIYLMDTPKGEYSCESCHGPGEAHIEEGDPEKIINPATSGQDAGQETCLGCHDGHQFDDWAFSAHRGADISCASCHQVHVPAEYGSVAAVPDLCYTCHSEVRAATHMPSHHPITEGKIDCLDCHNVHGGTVEFAMDDTGRELCFSCHADKEGPFVYEHAPVQEDCMICHTPHGAVADNLLKQSEPALCLNCHSMHFHAGVDGLEGEFTAPQASDRTVVSTHDGFKRAMLTKCTQCHTMIHGSDNPSQTISTGGNALTR